MRTPRHPPPAPARPPATSRAHLCLTCVQAAAATADIAKAAAEGRLELARSTSMPDGAVMLKTASMRGVRDLTARVSQAREQMGDEELIQAASQVQAKLKMFSAYEEELTGRAGGVGVLEKLIAQLLDAGCPPFRTFALTTRMDAAKASIDSLTSAGLAYKGRLEAELERLNKQDDMRLAFAKRADALNRQLEEKIDELTEVRLLLLSAHAAPAAACCCCPCCGPLLLPRLSLSPPPPLCAGPRRRLDRRGQQQLPSWRTGRACSRRSRRSSTRSPSMPTR